MTSSPADASSRIDAYIEGAVEEMREPLRRVRRAIREAAPGAVEVFGYGMPGFKYMGRPLLYFAAAKKHYALYGSTEAVKERLADQLQGIDIEKGTIRFAPGQPAPEDLLRSIILVRAEEIEAAEAAKKAKS